VFRFPPLTPFVKKLLIALFGAWIVQIIFQNWAGGPRSRPSTVAPS